MRQGIFLVVFFSWVFAPIVSDAVELYYNADNQRKTANISGNIVTEISYQKIGDNKSLSSYENGWDYFSQVYLTGKWPVFYDYALEGEITIRKTDNSTIDKRKDVRVKQSSLRLYNQDNLFLVGDYYQDFSQFSLTNSLEGFYAEVMPATGFKLQLVLGRSEQADTTVPDYQRNVFGMNLNYEDYGQLWGLDNFKGSFSIVSSQDDRATCGVNGAKDLDNTVVSWAGQMLKDNKGFNYEFAYSGYIEDRNTNKDRDWGWAVHLNPYLSWEAAKISYLFEYVDPEFYTAQGSATPDRLRHRFSFDWQLTDLISLSLAENFSYDHLDGSSLDKRTTDLEHEFTIRFNKSDDYIFSIYFDMVGTNSDDNANSEEAEDISFGFDCDRMISDSLSIRLGYERRNYSKEADKSLSEYSHKISFGLTKDGRFFGKEFYISPDFTVNIRKPKSYGKNDISFIGGFNGRYNLSDTVKLRGGININNTNGAGVNMDYVRKTSFVEWDWMFSEDHQARLVLRGERNVNKYSDASQNYRETRGVCRLEWSF